jgi:hemoglobin-like flavoprotein
MESDRIGSAITETFPGGRRHQPETPRRQGLPVSFAKENIMTPEQIRLVQTSFVELIPVSDQATSIFYHKLFELDPSTRLLFRDAGREQGVRLMGALSTIVRHLGNPGLILPTLEQLAVCHAAYGVAERHYDTIGRALLWTVEQAFGPDFTPPVREAWQTAYSDLASVMIRAARDAASAKVA